MAASLKLFPGSTVRWCGRRYMILDYAGLDAIIGREPGKRRPERIPVRIAVLLHGHQEGPADIGPGHTEKVAASGYDTRHVAQCHHSAR